MCHLWAEGCAAPLASSFEQEIGHGKLHADLSSQPQHEINEQLSSALFPSVHLHHLRTPEETSGHQTCSIHIVDSTHPPFLPGEVNVVLTLPSNSLLSFFRTQLDKC